MFTFHTDAARYLMLKLFMLFCFYTNTRNELTIITKQRVLLSSTVMNVVHDFNYSKECKVDEESSKSQVTDLMILNAVYDRVSKHIKSVYETIQKNYDVFMKLNILKGMLMKGDNSIQSKRSTPWIKYMSKYKNIFNSH